MAFSEIKRSSTRATRNSNIHASFIIDKNNNCYLNFYTAGISYLLENYKISIADNIPLKLFFDTKTDQVAVQLSNDGRFVFKKYTKASNALRVHAIDLLPVIKEKRKYRITRSLSGLTRQQPLTWLLL